MVGRELANLLDESRCGSPGATKAEQRGVTLAGIDIQCSRYHKLMETICAYPTRDPAITRIYIQIGRLTYRGAIPARKELQRTSLPEEPEGQEEMVANLQPPIYQKMQLCTTRKKQKVLDTPTSLQIRTPEPKSTGRESLATICSASQGFAESKNILREGLQFLRSHNVFFCVS